MWTIPRPTIGAQETFDTCVEGISVAEKKVRLEGIRQKIEEAEIELNLRGAAVELHLIAKANAVVGVEGNVSAREMGQLYDRHLARQKGRGRAIYDRIMMAAVHTQCPFCGHLPVSTLDHTLPKAHHPALAVTPINLIPCCKDCNHNKGTAGPNAPENQFLHPYFDDLTADHWLCAQIIQGSPPGATFYADPPDWWDLTTSARVQWHFRKLKLAELYASQAGRQLQNIRNALSNIYDAAGEDAVREDLLRRSQSCRAVTVNSWEGALYEAASESVWYCSGGFGT